MNVGRIDDYDADDYDANDDDDDDDYSDDDDDHDDDDVGRKMIIESIIILKIVFLDDCMSSMIIITMKGYVVVLIRWIITTMYLKGCYPSVVVIDDYNDDYD
jgi:hypothetical protein